MNEHILFIVFGVGFGIVGLITMIAAFSLLRGAFWNYSPPTQILEPDKHLDIECVIGGGDDLITIASRPIDAEIISQQKFSVRFDDDINEWSSLTDPTPLGSRFITYHRIHRARCNEIRLNKGHSVYIRLKNTSQEKIVVTQYLRTTKIFREGIAGIACIVLTATMLVTAWQFFNFLI